MSHQGDVMRSINLSFSQTFPQKEQKMEKGERKRKIELYRSRWQSMPSSSSASSSITSSRVSAFA